MEPAKQKSRHPIADGILGGLGAGSVFIAAEMIMSVLSGQAIFYPLRLIASIFLGVQVLDPSYSLSTAIAVGLVLHMFLAATFGLVFLFLVIVMSPLRHRPSLILYGFVYGIVLWLVNFNIIAPPIFPQFTQVNALWNGFIAHTVFYGLPLGWCLGVGGVQAALETEEPILRQKRYS